MTRPAIVLENVNLDFPTVRVGRNTIDQTIRRLFKPRENKTKLFPVLRDMSFQVNYGEVVGIIGCNGAGKSTLLRVMAGIYRPDSGTAKTAGRVSLFAGLGAGFQVNLSGRENVYLYGSMLGHSREMMDQLMEQIISFSELQAFMDQPLRTYSAGMRARLAFSVASAVQPEILLIDEVLAVGDAEFKERSKKRIKEMVSEAGTVVIASHSMPMLKQICNRMIFVENGRLQASGTPAEVIQAYNSRHGPSSISKAQKK